MAKALKNRYDKCIEADMHSFNQKCGDLYEGDKKTYFAK